MARKFRITVRVLRPPEDLISFLVFAEPEAAFSTVWEESKKRYRENYSAGRRQ